MKALKKTTTLLGCLALLAVILAGCARERRGPFDVPSAAPSSSGAVSSQHGGFSSGRTPDDVARAAAEISASRIHFDFDRADIRPEYRGTLDRVAALLRQHPSIRIGIQGHTDDRGGVDFNFRLGERRARAAYRYLMNAGVPASQVDMVTHGKCSPAVPGRTESAWARNRRVEFVVLTTCY